MSQITSNEKFSLHTGPSFLQARQATNFDTEPPTTVITTGFGSGESSNAVMLKSDNDQPINENTWVYLESDEFLDRKRRTLRLLRRIIYGYEDRATSSNFFPRIRFLSVNNATTAEYFQNPPSTPILKGPEHYYYMIMSDSSDNSDKILVKRRVEEPELGRNSQSSYTGVDFGYRYINSRYIPMIPSDALQVYIGPKERSVAMF